jgi:hypothetical protein
MNVNRFRGILCLCVVAMTSGMAAAGARDLPPNAYACHVMTRTAFPALVLVQANDVQQAIAMAQRTPATTFDGTVAQTFEVVECILPPAEKFRNESFQSNFEKMDR